MKFIDNEHCPEATMQRRNLLSLAAAAACSALLLGTAGCSDKAAEVAKQKGLTV